MTNETPAPVYLLPCPFCGAKPSLHGYHAPEFWVMCDTIGCKAHTEGFGSKDRAIAAWNRRAAGITPQTTTAEIASQEVVERVAQALWDHARGKIGQAPSPLPKTRTDYLDLAQTALSALPTTAALMADNARMREAAIALNLALGLHTSYGCPICYGDCASANQPVLSCPTQAAIEAYRKFDAALKGSSHE